MIRWIIIILLIALMGGATYYLYRERYKYQVIAVVDGFLFFIILLLLIFGGKKKEKEIDETESESANQPVMETMVEQSVVEETISENEIPEEPEKVVYHDLTLEEAVAIAQENNVTMTVNKSAVNVRSKPTTESDKVGSVYQNDVVYVICEEEASDGHTWCYVIYGKAASDTGKDSSGNTMFTIENKNSLGYIRKDLLK